MVPGSVLGRRGVTSRMPGGAAGEAGCVWAVCAEGVSLDAVHRSAAPTTISLIGVDAKGVPEYAFYGTGAADRTLPLAALDRMPADARLLHVGSYTMGVGETAATQRASSALALAKDREVEYGAALALALSGSSSRAQALADDLETNFPEDTSVRFSYLPVLRAILALNRRQPSRAFEVLESAKKTAHLRPRRTDTELAAGFGMDNPIDEWNPNAEIRTLMG